MMTNKKTVTVVVVICIILCAFFAGKYNNIVKLEVDCDTAQSQVETQMQRRLELIPDLVSTVKVASEHEEKIFEACSILQESSDELSETLNDSNSIEEISEANAKVTESVNGLLAYVQNVPEITATESYIGFMDQLEGSENRITQARREYNECVGTYNKAVRSFPGNIYASIFCFEKRATFKADEGADATNLVDFGN